LKGLPVNGILREKGFPQLTDDPRPWIDRSIQKWVEDLAKRSRGR
jgi:hypothetical protein